MSNFEVSRLEYQSALNLFRFDNYYGHRTRTPLLGKNSTKIHEYYEQQGQVATSEFVARFFNEIISEDGSDLHLISFFVRPSFNFHFSAYDRTLNIVLFPRSGAIKKYTIKSVLDCFSNIHKESDPLILRHIDYPNIVRVGGTLEENINSEEEFTYSPQDIRGALLFKKNPWHNAHNYPRIIRYLIDQRKEVTAQKFHSHFSTHARPR